MARRKIANSTKFLNAMLRDNKRSFFNQPI